MDTVRTNMMCGGAQVNIRGELFEVEQLDHAWRLYPLDYEKSGRQDNFGLAWQIRRQQECLTGTEGIFRLVYDDENLCYEYPTSEGIQDYANTLFTGREFSSVRYQLVPGANLSLMDYSTRLLMGELPIAYEAEMNVHDTMVHALGARALMAYSTGTFSEILAEAQRQKDQELLITLCDAYDLATASICDIRYFEAMPSLDLLTKVLLLANRYPTKRPDLPGICVGMLRDHGHTVEDNYGDLMVSDEAEQLPAHRQKVLELLS